MNHRGDVHFIRRARLIAALGASALLGSMLACGHKSNSDTMTSYSQSAAAKDTPELFTLPQDQMAHVQIVTVEPAPLTRMLRLTGVVAFNGFDTTPVVSQISGPVSRIVVAPGQNVRRGQPLLYIASPDYSQLLATYLKARDSFRLADSNYVRAKDLYSHHAIAERDLQAAESARAQAQADLGASEQSLHIMGVNNPDAMVGKPVSSEIPVLAPISGQAVERLVAAGQLVQAGATQLFTISNMSSVWVLANVYQKDLPYVRVGDPVTITTDAYPATEFHGKISYIAAALDPNTRTLQARIDVKNPEGKLKKDMYVVALVRAGTIPKALSVPSAAVLHDAENQPFVYAVNANNQFARKPVTTGETSENQIQITSGLAPGDRVVGDGSLFLQFANAQQR